MSALGQSRRLSDICGVSAQPTTQDLSLRRSERSKRAVISTGRRNTLVKSLCWRLEVQRFPGPLVELACHLVQLGLGVRREIKALGEVLAQQAIGVFA